MSAVLKTPPHSLDAEQCVLGGLMLGGSWFDVAAVISAGDFYRAQHQEIFEVMSVLADEGQPVDPILIADRMEASGTLERCGGRGYLAELAEGAPGATNILAYARMIRDHAIDRSLIGAAQKIWDLGFGKEQTTEKLNQAQSLIMSLSLDQRVSMSRPMRDVLRDVIEEVEERHKAQGAFRGLSTGFIDLDAHWRGLKPGNLVVIAGRPAMGKTTLAMNIATHNASEGKRVMVFSLEMSSEELAERCIASQGIAHDEIESGEVMSRPDGPPDFSKAISNLAPLDVIIDDSGGLDLPTIRGRVRQACVERPVDLVVVDHLQLMGGEGRDENSRLTAITGGLKQLAKELRCPVILLSQLNREVDKRPYGKNRPVMADLRASGSIEQDADIVAFVYRNSVYKPECRYSDVAEIITSKFRNGQTGTQYLRADFAHCRFQSYAGTRPEYDGPVTSDTGFHPEDFA